MKRGSNKKFGSILKRLGAEKFESFWHGQTSMNRAVQATFLALTVGYVVGGAEQPSVPFDKLALASAQPAMLNQVSIGQQNSLVDPMVMLLQKDASQVYVPTKGVQLNQQFRNKLQLELEKTLYSAERTGHWDHALATRVSRLQNSETLLDRQVANAVIRFIAEHQMVRFADIPQPAYYINANISQLESSRQAFTLVDAAIQATAKSKDRLTPLSIIQTLNEAGLPGNRIAALHAVQAEQGLQGRAQMDGSLLVRDVREQENLRISILRLAGEYLHDPSLSNQAGAQGVEMMKRFEGPTKWRDIDVPYYVAETDRLAMANYDNQPPTSIVLSRIELSHADGIAGRGVLLEDLGIDDPTPGLMPDNRIQRAALTVDLDWSQEDQAEFRVSF